MNTLADAVPTILTVALLYWLSARDIQVSFCRSFLGIDHHRIRSIQLFPSFQDELRIRQDKSNPGLIHRLQGWSLLVAPTVMLLAALVVGLPPWLRWLSLMEPASQASATIPVFSGLYLLLTSLTALVLYAALRLPASMGNRHTGEPTFDGYPPAQPWDLYARTRNAYLRHFVFLGRRAELVRQLRAEFMGWFAFNGRFEAEYQRCFDILSERHGLEQAGDLPSVIQEALESRGMPEVYEELRELRHRVLAEPEMVRDEVRHEWQSQIELQSEGGNGAGRHLVLATGIGCKRWNRVCSIELSSENNAIRNGTYRLKSISGFGLEQEHLLTVRRIGKRLFGTTRPSKKLGEKIAVIMTET